MNSDEVMTEPAGLANLSSEDGASQQSKAAAMNAKKMREEYDVFKHRLLDQKFSVADYPDPLAPRPPHPKQYPKGTDREMEQKLQKLIADLKASNGGAAS
ncbi:hypothetical protein VTK56DRAFT_3368 [Thermocarpiscus australiensis]